MATIKLRYEYFSIMGIIICLILMFRYPVVVKDGVSGGLNICFNTIIPSLFPFITLSSYITKSNVFSPIYKVFEGSSRLFFRQPPCSTSVMLLSMIGGYPVGIKMADELYKNQQLTKKQAQHLSLFCMNSGPAFVITVVGINMLNSTKAGIIMYISLCLSAVIIGLVSSFFCHKEESFNKNKRNIPLESSLTACVSDSLQSTMNICAWVILFSALTNCIKILNLNDSAYIITSSILEITKGCLLLCGKATLPILTGLIGFGGICVHCQVLTHIKNMEMKYRTFFLGRLIHGVLSSLISYILFLIFPVEIDVFSSFDKTDALRFSSSVPAFIVFIFMCIIMIFDIDRKKNVW